MAPQASMCGRCRARIQWAATAAGKPIPLNPEPVPPSQHGALVLIGSRAMGRADAVRRLGQLYGVDDPEADRMAVEEHDWYVAHFATCTRPTTDHQPT